MGIIKASVKGARGRLGSAEPTVLRTVGTAGTPAEYT